ncbi:MAG: 50S ribosomal protein L5 [Candidatus Methylacidiphilales bacterium]|nr:50S ribosomal protein L5 [Candidatus Methylacidiphilales bacterium]
MSTNESAPKAALHKLYLEQVIPALIKNRGYKNPHQVPKIKKVTVNCCIGSSPDTKAALEDAVNELRTITGQKPVKTTATKSISNFKLREGQDIGAKVTLRGKIMYEFLERLICTALPRIRDFRGVPARAFDGRGNYTLGVKDQTIFPEIELDKIKRNLGMDITIVTSAAKNDEAKELLGLMGMPFSDRKQPTA